MGARLVNVVLGLWMVLSTLVWRRSEPQFWNSYVCGLLIAGFSLVAIKQIPQARYGNTVVGGWLIVSAFLLPVAASLTRWNNLIVGLLVLIISLVPNLAERLRGPRHV